MLLQTAQLNCRTIFDVAQNYNNLTGSHAAAFKRIFQVTSNKASCNVGPALAAKYNLQQDNQQLVVSLTNRYTLEQTWFNQARTQKPQTFTQGSEYLDPTNGGAKCDFCNWPLLTATDPGFGRIELPHAVTGSNLFKYAEPSHGIVVFKHHEPLVFNQEALSDLLDAAWLWFQASHALNPTATQPFFLWNCLPRAGASQYHGHAQVMLTDVAVPGVSRLQQAADTYQQHHSSSYYMDLLRAHAAVGLLRQISIPFADADAAAAAPGRDAAVDESGPSQVLQQRQQQHVAWAFASLVPYKDMEVNIVGQHICCPAFQKMLHAALRAVIDGCGCRTLNVGVLNVDLAAAAPAGVGLERQFWSSSSSNSIRDEGGSSGNGSGNGSSSMAVSSSSSSMASSSSSSMGSIAGYEYTDSSRIDSIGIPDAWPWGDQAPVVARLVSRGKLSSVASDFGCLEVFGGASIGHTDPFLIVQQLDAQLGGTSSD